MNNRKAKKLRKEIYGEQSIKQKRKYLINDKGNIINDPKSLRSQYQSLKRKGQ